MEGEPGNGSDVYGYPPVNVLAVSKKRLACPNPSQLDCFECPLASSSKVEPQGGSEANSGEHGNIRSYPNNMLETVQHSIFAAIHICD
jgi:hypothetical protein